MLRKFLILSLVLVIALIAYIASRPSHFVVTRSVAIAAPPEAVFAEVNDLKRFNQWSPFNKKDPQMTHTYEGPAAGTGASSSWVGNSQPGEGKMTITESTPNERILIQIDFIKPVPTTNQATFTFKPVGQQTEVSWAIEGKATFMAKAFQLFFNVEDLLGNLFSEGLTSLKKSVEARRNVTHP